jgi:hypothetical protein
MRRILLALGLLALPCSLRAQSAAVPQNVATVGTSIQSGGQQWHYLLWRSSDFQSLAGEKIAVYQKNGIATAASNYSRIAVVEGLTDAATVATVLNRAEKLGDNLLRLEAAIQASFGSLLTNNSLTLQQKIAAVVAGTHGDEDQHEMLDVVAASHPGLAMSLGHAFATQATGIKTYELRTFDTATSTDGDVIGRVTIDSSSIFTMPAPGKPVQVTEHLVPPPATAAAVKPEPTGKDDLLVRLRWATPNPLRDASLMQHGFNLYRVNRVFAEGFSWHLTPPSTAVLLSALAGNPTEVKRVNSVPIITERTLDDAQARYDTDLETYFVADDNGRYQTGGVPFADGAEYYYFTTARDILGRDGDVSAASALVTLCDRMPPMPPQGAKVENTFSLVGGVRTQKLKVSWKAAEDSSGVKEYYLYRWESMVAMQSQAKELDAVQKKPERNLIAIIPHVGGVDSYAFTDDGTTAPPAWANVTTTLPTMPAREGVSYYYTVRAMDDSACGGNLSKNSAPAIGALHDHVGPAAPADSMVVTKCYEPATFFKNFTNEPNANYNAAVIALRLLCLPKATLPVPVRRHLAWAEFYKKAAGGGDTLLARVPFIHDGTMGSSAELITAVPNVTSKPQIGCRVGLDSGAVSPIIYTQDNGLQQVADKRIVVNFEADIALINCPDGSEHVSFDWANPGQKISPVITFTPPAGSAEYRLYRRVNEGDYQLIAEDQSSAGVLVLVEDDEVSITSGRVCYYLQMVDENGNPGVREQVSCIDLLAELPTPMLTPLERQGSTAAPTMRVKWFCPPHGVERFELWVGRSSGTLPSPGSSGLSADLASHPNTSVDTAAGIDFAVYDTPLVRLLSPNGSSSTFSFDLPVELNATYEVLVRAVGVGSYSSRPVGLFSNQESFTWVSAGVTGGIDVPWPARPQPAVSSFHSGIQATYVNLGQLDTTTATWEGVGVRIGEVPTQADNPVNKQLGATAVITLDGHEPPESYVYSNSQAAAAEEGQMSAADAASLGASSRVGIVLPVAMYRIQVANAAYPVVSGDMVQVTPLVEQIAYEETNESGRDVIKIRDPYIGLVSHFPVPQNPGSAWDLLLLDRHPVLQGASYQYLLVRYKPNREVERVIVTNTITTRALP